jgi:type IV pilus assembly protein PilB
VTGPTGSGKTTTLYSALDVLNRPDKKIITAEDPVEYNFAGINQCQVRDKIGLTFRSILRVDAAPGAQHHPGGRNPRQGGGEIAIQAALTGHLVFSTLHTNDAPSAITRLIDMGVKPFLVASSIQAIMAQRLIRVLCKQCKAPDPNPDPKYLRCRHHAGGGEGAIYKAGLPQLQQHRLPRPKAIFEMMLMNSKSASWPSSARRSPDPRGRDRNGMRPLLGDGKIKILKGVTTPAEVASRAQVEASTPTR